MSGTYLVYPPKSGGSGGGSSSPTVVTIGSMDSFAASPFGATASGSAVYMQSASATAPGLVNITTQTFAGAKTFASPLTVSNLTQAPVLSTAGGLLTNGSISLVNQVVGNLPLSQTSGSISLVNQVSGNLPLSQTSGSLSLVNQVVGNLPLSQTSGSISLVNQVSGNLPLAQTSGSISLVNQVVGNLPLSQTSGSISLVNQVSGILPQANLTLAPTFTQATIGSVTQTSSAGGSAYSVYWPGTTSSGTSLLYNNGLGGFYWGAVPAAGTSYSATNWTLFSLSWQAAVTNPTLGSVVPINTAAWRRDGPDMLLKYIFKCTDATGGNDGSGTYYFALPSAQSWDSNIININTFTANGSNLGTMVFGNSDLMYVPMPVSSGGSNNLIKFSTGNGTVFDSAKTFFTNATRTVSFQMSVPISGWTINN